MYALLCSAACMCVSASVQQEYSARAGHRLPLNIHDIVRGCRLTQGEILCGYCKQIHCTVIGPLTHTHTHTTVDTRKSLRMMSKGRGKDQ